MSIGMSFYPQAVVLKGKVYVGGGSAINNNQNTIVMCYDIEHNQWTILPEYNCILYFAMTAINEELVLVGGRHPSTNRTTRAI